LRNEKSEGHPLTRGDESAILWVADTPNPLELIRSVPLAEGIGHRLIRGTRAVPLERKIMIHRCDAERTTDP